MGFRDMLVRVTVIALLFIGITLAVTKVSEPVVAHSMATAGNWLVQNWVVVGLFIFGIVTLVAVEDWHSAKDAAKGLFLLAEKAMADLVIATGPEAMQTVVASLYAMLPSRVKSVLNIVATLMGTTPEEVLHRLTQRWYEEIRRRYSVALWTGVVNTGSSDASQGVL